MSSILRFDRTYCLITVAIFAVELFIALFVDDRLIRPFVGDVLVVILVYCFIRTFLDFPILTTALGVLIFAFAIETLQYFDFVKLLGLEKNVVLSTALGRTFAWLDLVSYFVGFPVIVLCEKFLRKAD